MHVAESEPYPWPWDGAGPECWAVLVVDCAMPAPAGLGARLQAWLDHTGRAGVPTYRVSVGAGHVRQLPADWLGPTPVDETVAAPGWNGFSASPLDDLLRASRRRTLLLTGYWLEVGVHSTLRAANDMGYECAVVADLCTPWDTALAPGALSTIRFSGGIFGAVVSSGAVADRLGTANLAAAGGAVAGAETSAGQ
ncbi:cysteine hydrolase family protein [Cellulomonas sp. URHB0016]